MSTKLNIIRYETRRIINNCLDPNDSWKYLEKMKQDFRDSGYSDTVINTQILNELNKQKSSKSDKPKPNPQYVLKIPYIDEATTRIVKKLLKDAQIDARVVVTAGKELKSIIRESPTLTCQDINCILCKSNIPCKTSNYVYKFKFNNCPTSSKDYIGCSRKFVDQRFEQHESSVRRYNNITALGQHMCTAHPDLKIPAADVKRGTIDMSNFLKNFTPEILKSCKDTLDTYLWEGLMIRDKKPSLNNMQTNGFIDAY